MIYGKIVGKVTTNKFSFDIDSNAEVKKFDYVQVYHKVYDYVLAQIIEIEKTINNDIAICQVIGFRDKDERIKSIKIPFDLGSEVLLADDDFIKKIISLKETDNSAYIGRLDGKKIDIKGRIRPKIIVRMKSFQT